MRKSYYLVRFKDNTISGPMTYRKLTSQMLASKSILSAEISGDLGPWVFLDNEDDLKLYYPQLLEFMKQNSIAPPEKNLFGKIKNIFAS